MKQLEARAVTVGENTFYIRPLPAFKAANMTGELAAVLLPLLTSLSPLLAAAGREEGGSLLDVQVDSAMPAVSNAFAAISGDKLELLMKRLLLDGRNISVEPPGEKPQVLTEDLANELFCEEVQDMFLLAFEVIRTNYSGFFKKVSARFGPLMDGLMKTVTS